MLLKFAVAIGPAVLTTYSRYRPEMRAHLEPALALIYPKPPAGPIATSFIVSFPDPKRGLGSGNETTSFNVWHARNSAF